MEEPTFFQSVLFFSGPFWGYDTPSDKSVIAAGVRTAKPWFFHCCAELMKKRFMEKNRSRDFWQRRKKSKKARKFSFLGKYFPVLSSKQKATSTTKRKTIRPAPSLSKHGYIFSKDYHHFLFYLNPILFEQLHLLEYLYLSKTIEHDAVIFDNLNRVLMSLLAQVVNRENDPSRWPYFDSCRDILVCKWRLCRLSLCSWEVMF